MAKGFIKTQIQGFKRRRRESRQLEGIRKKAQFSEEKVQAARVGKETARIRAKQKLKDVRSGKKSRSGLGSLFDGLADAGENASRQLSKRGIGGSKKRSKRNNDIFDMRF